MLDSVKVGNPDGTLETHRASRLHFVLGFVTARLANLDVDLVGVAQCINFVHDHKGELTVQWNQQPQPLWRTAFDDAWVASRELRENVVHELFLSPQQSS